MGRNGGADTTSLLNIGEEYHTSERMVNVVFVYVLHCHGQPLMPCQPRTARLLLKEGKAKVVRMVPFTLQLLYGSSGYTQEISLGIDAGTHHLGVSATTEQHVLFEAEVQPRTDIQALLATRRQFRRARRSRKTRYRKCRCLNRVNPIYAGSIGKTGLEDVPWIRADPLSSRVTALLFFVEQTHTYQPLHTGGRYPDGSRNTKILWILDESNAPDTMTIKRSKGVLAPGDISTNALSGRFGHPWCELSIHRESSYPWLLANPVQRDRVHYILGNRQLEQASKVIHLVTVTQLYPYL